MAQDSTQHSKAIRIDWSENVELYQTQEEKSPYYHTILASVNTAVLYAPEKTTSLGKISNVKSHHGISLGKCLNLQTSLTQKLCILF